MERTAKLGYSVVVGFDPVVHTLCKVAKVDGNDGKVHCSNGLSTKTDKIHGNDLEE